MSVKTIPGKAKAKVTRKSPRVKVSVRLDPDIHQRVSQIAEADQRSFSQVVELILAHALGKGCQQSAAGSENVEQNDPALSGNSLLSQLSQSAPQGSWSQTDAYDAALYNSGDGGGPRLDHEIDFLSAIVQELNDTYGLNLTDDDKVDIERIKFKLEANDELRDVLTGDNSIDAMRYKFDQIMNALILEFVHGRIDLYQKLTKPDTNAMFKEKWFGELYRKYHGS